jgi:hypothetical protein
MTTWIQTSDNSDVLTLLNRSPSGVQLASSLGLAPKPEPQKAKFSSDLAVPIKIAYKGGRVNNAVRTSDVDEGVHRAAFAAFGDYRSLVGDDPSGLRYRRHCGPMAINNEKRRGVRRSRGGEPASLHVVGYRQSSCFVPIDIEDALPSDVRSSLSSAIAGRIHSAYVITDPRSNLVWVVLRVELFTESKEDALGYPWYPIVNSTRDDSSIVFLPPRCIGPRLMLVGLKSEWAGGRQQAAVVPLGNFHSKDAD